VAPSTRRLVPPPNTSPARLGSWPQPVITAAMRDLAIPGPVVLVCTRTEEYRVAFDTRVLRTHDPVQTGDQFRVGSNTKTIMDKG
jgi:hypothetical protein